jgi:Flp pilus assembly protein TadD
VAVRAELNQSYEEAAKLYAALLAQDPSNTGYMLSLARNLRYAGRTQAAIDLLIRPEAPKDDPIALLELGKCYLAADQLNLAKPALEKAKAAAPLNWEIPSTLGVVLDYMNQNDLAQAEYAVALQLSPDNPTVLNNLALSLAQVGKLDEAIATMEHAVDQQSAQAQSRQNLALLMALKGRPDDAERLIRKDLPPDMAENNINYYRSFQIVPTP